MLFSARVIGKVMKLTPKTLALAFIAGFSFLLAAPAANANTLALVDITDDAQYSYTWNTDYTLGFQFSVTDPITYNALGVFDAISATRAPGSTSHNNAAGLNSSHVVGLWNAAGTLLVSATVDPTDPWIASQNTYGKWIYQTITPMTLSVGTYTVGALYLRNSDPVMVQQTAVENVPGILYGSGRYAVGATLARPTGTYPLNEEQYFGPTLLSVPDGGLTAMLLGMGLLGLGYVRRMVK